MSLVFCFVHVSPKDLRNIFLVRFCNRLIFRRKSDPSRLVDTKAKTGEKEEEKEKSLEKMVLQILPPFIGLKA